MIDSNLKKNIGTNIDQLNQLFINIDSSIKRNSESLGEYKGSLSEEEVDNVILNINSNYDSIINEQLVEIKSNLGYIIKFWKKFRVFSLGMEYKEAFHKIKSCKDMIMKNLKEYGLSFLNAKESPVQVIKEIKPIKSLDDSNWAKISNNLKNNQRFLLLRDPLNNHIHIYLNRKFNEKIEKAKLNYVELTEDDILNYKTEFFKNRIDFDDYWIRIKKKSERADNGISSIPSIKKVEMKASENPKTFDNYEAYLKSDERQLARMKRAGVYDIEKKRKRRVRKPKKSSK